MTKIVLQDLASLTNETAALAAINSNSAVIETASDNSLSRDGTSPNEMNADLDMNSHRVLNLPAPVQQTEPLRFQDLVSFNATLSPVFDPDLIAVGNLSTTGIVRRPSTNTWTAGGTVSVSEGGTGNTTQTTDGIVYYNGTFLNTQRATLDTNSSIAASSSAAFKPEHLTTNISNDANNAFQTLQKNRAGGNTNSGDGLGTFQMKGFANGAQQNTVQINARQTAAATGSNIPSAIDFKNSDSSGQINQTWVMDGGAKSFVLPLGGTVNFPGSSSGTATITTAAAAGTTNFRLPVGNGSNLQVLQTDGSGNTSWATQAAAVSTPTKQYLITGTGATYTTPANTRAIHIQMIGGGGGGGAAITNNGNSGGTTIFNSINANGGSGGLSGGNNNGFGIGGAGGTGGTGTASFRLKGQDGGNMLQVASGWQHGGCGASGMFGMGGGKGGSNTAGTAASNNTGAGGGGGAAGQNSDAGGGGGGSGEMVFLEITTPASTYTYTIGAGGTAGAAGTNAGGNGGTGLIIVTEYY